MMQTTKHGRCLLIGLSGYAQSGKDHTAELMGDWHQGRKEVGEACRLAFADPIKQHVNDMFGWNYDHAYGHLKEVVDPYWGFSPRRAYQLFGTEFGRTLSPDLWVKMLVREMYSIQTDSKDEEHPTAVYITDVRFHNEYNAIKELGGIVVSIVRPDMEPSVVDGRMVFPSGVAMHESESYIQQIRTKADLVIKNDLAAGYARDINKLKKLITTNS